MKRHAVLLLASLVVVSILTASCGDSTTGPDPTPPPFDTEIREGTLRVAPDHTVAASDLKAVSFTAESEVSEDGSFSLEAPVSEKQQLILFVSEQTGNPIYIGISEPDTRGIAANDTSTALALLMFNPYLTGTTREQREDYLEAAVNSPEFAYLIQTLQQSYEDDAETALSYEDNPLLYQRVVETIRAVMISLGPRWNADVRSDPPSIEDAPGSGVRIVNPRHVYYAAGVYPDAGDQSQVLTIERVQTLIEFEWGWPPVSLADPEPTDVALTDGYYKLYLTRGLDFTKLLQFNDPDGRATVLNTVEGLLYIVDIVLGVTPDVNVADFPRHFHLDADDAYGMALAIKQGQIEDFIVKLCAAIADNSESLAYWIFQEYQTNAAHQFISAASDIMGNVVKVLDLLGYVNEHGPFFWDLFASQRDVTYFVTLEEGDITSTEQDLPPTAGFTVYPPAGIIGTVFEFDASTSEDDLDEFSELVFRWDWDADGTYETGWSSSPTATHTYNESGAHAVALEVRDTRGLCSCACHILSVGGGAGTASHVKLFRDNLPWDSNATVEVLEDLGMVEGTGPDTYELVGSDEMSCVALIPGEDLVIICNDQEQSFYDNYAGSQLRFNAFVQGGGSVLWEACDEGWADGSMSSAGVILPGDVRTLFDYDKYNYVTAPDLPLLYGVPASLDHYYASHESFWNLPDGTTVYTVDESSNPTLAEYSIGSGWVVVTGQPLEHQFDYNWYTPDDMSQLLPRIIGYFLGRTLRGGTATRPLPQDVSPSSNVMSE